MPILPIFRLIDLVRQRFGTRRTRVSHRPALVLLEALEERQVLSVFVPEVPAYLIAPVTPPDEALWADLQTAPPLLEIEHLPGLESEMAQGGVGFPSNDLPPPSARFNDQVFSSSVPVESSALPWKQAAPPVKTPTVSMVASDSSEPTFQVRDSERPTESQATPTSRPRSAPADSPTVALVRLPNETSTGLPRIQLQRTAGPDVRVEVRYTITAIAQGQTWSYQGTTVLRPGVHQVELPGQLSVGSSAPEIVTVQLQGTSAGGATTTTVFVEGDARGCSDAALVTAYQTGHSEEALTTLIDRHQSVVMRTCQRVLGNWHDAEDVSQLVFLALAQGQFRLQSTLAGWLRTVARNAAIVLLRARHRRQRHEQLASQAVEVHPDDTQKELREEIDAALKQLPGNLREAVQLRYLDGWSQAEAAQMLGCPRGTLSQRAANGMQQLSDLLASRPTLAESYLY